jgi:small subunit ribosomal protein S33
MSRSRLPSLAAAAWSRLAGGSQQASSSLAHQPLLAAAGSAGAARWRSAAAAPSPPALAAATGVAAPSTSATDEDDEAPPPGSDKAIYGGQTLAAIRARIFGTHLGDGRPSGRKLLRRALIGPAVAAYYPPDPAAMDPLWVNVDDTRRVSKLERMTRRGKAPPKKGEGKRAGKKKR